MARRLASLGLTGWGLNLGCGSRPEPDWVNHDATKHSEYVEAWWNLEHALWPSLYWDPSLDQFAGQHTRPPDGLVRMEFARVKMKDVLEHLPPNLFFQTMNHLWDLVVPGGTLEIQVPEHNSYNAVVDPTHWRGFHLDSLDILDATTFIGRKNRFYGHRPWKILSKSRIPKSTVNLAFCLARA